MILIAKFVAVLLIVFGCFVITRPGILRRLLEVFKKENMPYAAGVLKMLVGIIFVVASAECNIPWVAALFGWFNIFTGIAVLVIKKELMMRLIGMAEEKSDTVLKRPGAVVLGVGILLVYAI